MVWMEIGEYQVGVFQGTITGPILFIIVFNDLITLLITQWNLIIYIVLCFQNMNISKKYVIQFLCILIKIQEIQFYSRA